MKILLFVLCVTSLLGSVTSAFIGVGRVETAGFSDFRDILKDTPYESTSLFSNEIYEKMYVLSEMAMIQRAISENEKTGSVSSNLLENFEDAFDPGVYETFTDGEAVSGETSGEDSEKRIVLSEDDIAILESRYNFWESQMEGPKGIFYYFKDEDLVITNDSTLLNQSLTEAKKKVEDYPASYQYEKGVIHIVPDSADISYHYGIEPSFDFNNSVIYLGFTDSFLSEGQAFLIKENTKVMTPFTVAAVLVLITIVLFVILMILTGKRDEEGNPVLNFADRIYTEVQLGLIGLFFIGGGVLYILALFYGLFGNRFYVDHEIVWTDPDPSFLFLALLVGIPCAACGLELILSVVRNLKYKRLIRNAFLYQFKNLIVAGILKLWNPLKEMFQEFVRGGTVMRKILLLVSGLIFVTLVVYTFFCMLFGFWFYDLFEGLVVTCLVMFIALGIGSRFILPHVRQYEEIKTGLERVKNGELSYKIPIISQSELGELAADINNISEGFDIAVQNEMKNQRLKTELISNVSHDIKTPLTSIITYVDLLKKEGLDSSNAPEYLDILEQKSFRLKKLTEDLFDAAKASSGAITVQLEEVEILSLINQGLGEMNSKIEEAGLMFKIYAERDRYYVMADGQLLWRVVENLLSNIIKYAQEHTRVYVDVRDEGNAVIMEFKNISKMELNIPEEELMERFKRGDESRTTEGSGLGLAIARDLVRVQNGEFALKIDGDLFKAIVKLPKSGKIL